MQAVGKDVNDALSIKSVRILWYMEKWVVPRFIRPLRSCFRKGLFEFQIEKEKENEGKIRAD